MTIIQGGPTPVATVAPVDITPIPALADKALMPNIAVKAAAKSEAAPHNKAYTAPGTGDAKGRRVDVEA